MTLSKPQMPERLRLPAILLGCIFLIGGVVWSIARLDLAFSELKPVPLLANVFIVQPAILAVAAVTLGISARVVNSRINFSASLKAVSYSSFAEILPIPGGALVRGAALMRSGADLRSTTYVITLTSILTLTLLGSLSSGALLMMGTTQAWPVLALTILATLFILVSIAKRVSIAVTAAVVGARLATAAVGALSIYFALAAIAAPSGALEATLLTVSGSLGTAVSIVPAGLGISEAIAAGLATLTDIRPEAAFLAVALHRALGLVASLAILVAMRLVRHIR